MSGAAASGGSKQSPPSGAGTSSAQQEMNPDRYSCSPFRAWASVGILLLFSQISIMDRQIIALLVEPIKASMGLSDTQLGLLQGLAFALTYAVAGLPIGFAVDRLSRKHIIFAGVFIWSLSAAACGLARNFMQMFIARSFVGVGEATVAPVSVSLISEIFPRKKVGFALGIYSAGYSIGSGLALLIGGAIIGFFAGQDEVMIPLIGAVEPWQAVFIVTGIPGMVLAFFAFGLFEPHRTRTPPVPAPDETPASSFFKDNWAVLTVAYIGFAMSTLVSYAIAGWTPAYLMRHFEWEAQDIGLALGLVIGGGGLAGSLLGGALIDQFHKRGYAVAPLLTGVVGSVVSLPLLIGAYLIPDPVVALVVLGLGWVAFQMNGPASYASWSVIATPDYRGRVTTGFVFIASLFGTGLGPLAVGFTTDYVMGSEALVGMSILLVIAITLPVMTLLLWLARHMIIARS